MKLNIDLSEGGPEMVTSPSRENYYPTLHVNTKEELDIPKEGTMTIRYKKTGSSESERGYSCTFEAREIVSIEGEESEAPSKKHNESDDALDKLMSEKSKKKY